MTLNEMLNTREWQSFEDSILGNDLFINDPDRAKRVYEYAEDGCNGSTHAEVIHDWRDFLDYADYDDDVTESIIAEIDACEAWHEENGSLFSIIG